MTFHRQFAASLVLAFALATPAFATPDVTFVLDKYVGSGTPSAAPYGHVDLTTNGANVDVKVTLANLDGFVNTGAGDWLFFDLSNFLTNPSTINSAITVTNISTPANTTGLGYEKATLSGTNLNLLHSGGAGDWEVGIYCKTGCFNGGSQPDPGMLMFTVTNVTVANFTANNSGYYFSADLCTTGIKAGGGCGGANTTGNAVADGATTTHAPEPMTIAIFGAGLAGLSLLRRRKPAKA